MTPYRPALIAGIGAGLGIALMIGMADLISSPVAAVPFATSIVLVMAAPDTPAARARCIIGGHLFCAIAGFVMLWLFGPVPLLAAPAVGLGVAAMVATDTLHPPAGMNGVLIVMLAPPWTFVLVPVLAGALILVAFAAAYHRLARGASVPDRTGAGPPLG